MQMRKGNEGQGTARSASKAPGRKQSGEQASPANENTAGNHETNQGTAAAQSTAQNQGRVGDQGTSGDQGTPNQQKGAGEKDLMQHAKQATGEIINQVQGRAGSQLNRQKEAAASELSQVANAVRRIGDTLNGEESGKIVQYAAEYGEKAADRIEQLSNYIREQDPKQLLDDVQNFGRRRPALLLGGAFLLGFAGARLIKSAMDMGSRQQSTAPNAV